MTEITLESKTGRIVPAWLYVSAGLVVVAFAAVCLQLHALTAEVHAASAAVAAQSERAAQCPAPAPVPETAEIVAAETAQRTATRPRRAAQTPAPIPTQPTTAAAPHSAARWGTTDLDREIAAFSQSLTTAEQESAK